MIRTLQAKPFAGRYNGQKRILMTALLFASFNAFSMENEKSLKDVKISLKVEKQSFKTILGFIEGKTGFTFIYSDRLVNRYTNIGLLTNNESLEVVLDKLLKSRAVSARSTYWQ